LRDFWPYATIPPIYASVVHRNEPYYPLGKQVMRLHNTWWCYYTMYS